MSTRPADYPKTPELDKLRVVEDASHIIGAFLEWLGEKEMYIATDGELGQSHPVNDGIEKILAAYFDIDLRKVDDEKRAILDWQRKQNEGGSHG